MRKILLSVAIVFILLIVILLAFVGTGIGSFRILSIGQMIQKNSEIDVKISEANRLISIDYPEKSQDLKDENNLRKEAKDEYLKLTANSSETEILKATMQEGYQIDFLYTRIGNHAKSKGVWTEMKIITGDYEGVKDINFTVEGSYVGITDFIYEIENDTKLNFRINEFKLVPKDDKGNVLRATFVTKNIRIEGQILEENLTNENDNQNNEENQENQNTDLQNDVNTNSMENTIQ